MKRKIKKIKVPKGYKWLQSEISDDKKFVITTFIIPVNNKKK